MAVPVFPNQNEASSKQGGGNTFNTFPDVCLTPPLNPGGSFIPVPYANAIDGQAANGNKQAQKIQKEVVDMAKSMGNKHVNSCTQGALVSNIFKRKVDHQTGPSMVMMEGKEGKELKHLLQITTQVP